MLLGKLKRFDILFLGFSLSILLVLLSALTQSFSIFWHDSRAWKFATELGQLVGGLATFGTLIWLVVDRLNALKKSDIESIKSNFMTKASQSYDLTEVSVFEPMDSFMGNADEVQMLLSKVSECGDQQTENECRKVLFSIVKKQLNQADMLVLLSVITNAKVNVSREHFESVYSEVNASISHHPAYKRVDEDLQPHLINILAIIHIARKADCVTMAWFFLSQIRNAYLRALQSSNHRIAGAINKILNSDGKNVVSYEFMFANMLRVYRLPVLAGIFLACSEDFIYFEIDADKNERAVK